MVTQRVFLLSTFPNLEMPHPSSPTSTDSTHQRPTHASRPNFQATTSRKSSLIILSPTLNGSGFLSSELMSLSFSYRVYFLLEQIVGAFPLPLPKLEFLKTTFSVHHPSLLTPAPGTVPSKGLVLKEQTNECPSSKHKTQQQNGLLLSLRVGLIKTVASGTQTEDLRELGKWGSQGSGSHRDGESIGNMKPRNTWVDD